ncbi:hypothetical protein [Streptococcus cuniculi]|uniref:Uncharacterized protein n=1 Tax=Streptococcus cuniculi TaxID=1432788 RepID=A0A4Y9JBY5_9STRE|nr:hypothetical protein [Streptococcus cuniculi]MBF0777445.1 hypothetical protein [Streptococcus cuniculi]TFU98503.1 hypothetical protein E4T82_01665 [Streptococcus cuniculi]
MVYGALEELLGFIRQKERELTEKEEDYYRNKRRLEERMRDLDDRHRRLSAILEQEQNKMKQLLIHHDASQEEAGSFYAKVQELQDESQWAYKDILHTLEEEIEETKRLFYHERDQLETELHDLRREYNDIGN